jgi:hypothetical protein
MCTGLITGMIGSCCASLTCSACGKMGSGISHVTRLCYGMFLLLATLLSFLFLTDWASGVIKDALKKVWFSGLADEDKIPAQLVGALAVYRVMAGAFLFHIIIALCVVGVKNSTDARAKIQNSGMCIKFVLFIALIVAMFFFPAEPFVYLAGWPFKLGGALFIIVQLVFLVTFSFDLYEGLIGLAEEQEERGQNERTCIWANWVTLALTLFFYGFCIAVFVLIVIMHTEKGGCPLAVTAGCVDMALMVAVSCLSISSHVREATNGPGQLNGVFQASMISAYACYQVLSAFVNNPDDKCHMWGHVYQGSSVMKGLGLVFTFVAVLWSAIRSGSNGFFENKNAGYRSADDIEGAKETTEPLNGGAAAEEDGTVVEGTKHTRDEVVEVQYSYSQFHIMFALACMYIANLLTRWGELDISEGLKQDNTGIQDSDLSVGLKIGASFLCFLFYMWIMLAPPCFPDREFNSS